jgi:pilus assembly protein CpaB
MLALICGLSAAVGMNWLANGSRRVSAPEMQPVVVAATEIPRGRMIAAGDVRVSRWPKAAEVKGTLASPEEVVDRAALVPMIAGEPVLNTKLAPKDAGRGLAALVPRGMRAYTIQASRAAASVAGFILPGNKVDVLLNLRGNPTDDSGGGSTTTLLQSVEILAVDQQLDAPAENKVNPKELSSVTLLVTPGQAALLDLGQNLGQLTLSLRNPEDREAAATRPATLTDIRYRQEKPFDGWKLPLAWFRGAAGAMKKGAAPKPSAPESTESTEAYRILMLRGSDRSYVAVKAGR